MPAMTKWRYAFTASFSLFLNQVNTYSLSCHLWSLLLMITLCPPYAYLSSSERLFTQLYESQTSHRPIRHSMDSHECIGQASQSRYLRFVFVLKQVAVSFVPLILYYDIFCQKSPHEFSYSIMAAFDQKMSMIVHQWPSAVFVSDANAPRQLINRSLSWRSSTIFFFSIPRMITWCSVPGA